MLDWVVIQPFRFDLTRRNRKKLFRSIPFQKVGNYFFLEQISKGYPLQFFRKFTVPSQHSSNLFFGQNAIVGHLPDDRQALGPAQAKSTTGFTISLTILSEFSILCCESC